MQAITKTGPGSAHEQGIIPAGLRIEQSSFVRAWVESQDADGPISVTLLVNGAIHWSGVAERLEHLRFDTDTPRVPCGLWVPLPIPTTAPQQAEITLVSGDTTLAEASTDLSERYRGFVDRIELGLDGLFVEGWAQDTSRPLDAVHLEVRSGERTIGSVTANRFREDLHTDNIGLGLHAFSDCIRRPVREIEINDLKVVIAGTEIPLRSSDALLNYLKSAGLTSGERVLDPSPSERIVLKNLTAEPPESVVAGVCDKITEEEILGWALDLEDRDQPVVLDLLINNFVVATTQTDRFRADIAEKHQCSGFAGFHFEITPQMRLGKTLNVAVLVRKTGHILPHGRSTILPSFTKSLPAPASQREPLSRSLSFKLPAGKNHRAAGGSVALIVLTKDGGALLDRHFQTFFDHNTYKNAEHVVVDHGSSDGTEKVIEKWKAVGLAITFIQRGDNYSFSASNNYAVACTRAEYLLFCNNDIFFIKDVLPAFIDVLGRENVGVAGIKLLDESMTGDEFSPRLVQHLGVFFNTAKYDRIVHPVEARHLPILQPYLGDNFQAPAVTGAFLGIKRDDFLKAGGFCEHYFYGYEDIDLCLQVKLVLHKLIAVVANTDAIHFRGFSRKKTGVWGGAPMRRNSQLLSGRFGLAMRRILRSNVLADHQYWTATKPIIAFAVSEAGTDTSAGDFFTAYELAQELSVLIDATFVFLEEQKNWYDVRDIDILVVMTHNYNLSAIQRPKQSLITVGWARNWFPEWAKAQYQQFDIVFSSSPKGAAAIRKSLGHPEQILRIATNPHRFFPDPPIEKTVDYVFTGSFWGHARDLIYWLEPAALPYTCEIYGTGWEKVESLAPYAKGFVKYDDLADIYRRARVVVDDANSVTKEWGSVNSRVFDAISAGALVITNSIGASEDAFSGKLPVFRNREELEGLLRRFCGNEEDRIATLEELQNIVHEQHTYAMRAQQFVTVLTHGIPRMFRIAIKVPCPSEKEAHLWGDYHFARSLAKELRVLGHSVRLDLLDQWHHENRLRDDVVICLRGLSSYTPTPDQVNICWLISHPDTVSMSELRKYDQVYVASRKYGKALQQQGFDNVEVLLQCVDTDMFQQATPLAEKEFDVLFVGNSRNVLRPIVRDAIAIDAPLTIIGSGWEDLVPKRLMLRRSVPHEELPATYASARVILNDHWDSMHKQGFISNRLFDCVALGAYVISDPVEGIGDLFGPLVKQYQSVEELKKLVEDGLNTSSSYNGLDEAANVISASNSFKARAKVISDFIIGSFDAIWRDRSKKVARCA